MLFQFLDRDENEIVLKYIEPFTDYLMKTQIFPQSQIKYIATARFQLRFFAPSSFS